MIKYREILRLFNLGIGVSTRLVLPVALVEP